MCLRPANYFTSRNFSPVLSLSLSDSLSLSSSLTLSPSQRCKKRLRESRNKLLERFRKITSEPTNEEDPAINNSSTEASLIGAQRIPSPLSIAASVEEVVREEWEHVRMEYGNLPCLPSVPKKSTDKVLSKEEDFIMVCVCVCVCGGGV